MDTICSALGGRCSEKFFFGEITTGASDDLDKCYQIAYQMVTKLGMSARLGYNSYNENKYGVKNFSEKTNEVCPSAYQDY